MSERFVARTLRHDGLLLAPFVVLAFVLPAAEGRSRSVSPIIERIEIVVEDVFDDGGGEPSFWGYRLANRLHIDTRESVIRRELLFVTGEPLDEEALAQTERNLRALPFLRDASVVAEPVDPDDDGDGPVVVRVTASDAWSTQPEVRLAKVGETWVWGVGGAETNFLGRGKQIRVLRDVGLDRDETFALYRDPRLLGSRVRASVLAASASDGHRRFLAADRPYFALDTAWSFRAVLEDFDRLDPIYEDGERVAELRHRRNAGELELSRAVVRRPEWALRLHAAYVRSDDDVGDERRRFGVARFGVTTLSHRFRKVTHLNRFERPDDVNLGHRASAFVGVSSPALGGEPSTSLFFFLSAGRGLALGDDGFVLAAASWEGRRRNDRVENAIARSRVDVVKKIHPRRVLLAKADFRYGSNLDPEVQLRLGAESGLRGYPVRQFNGSRSLLLSAEARFFLVDDLARLVSLGGAVFADSGFAWPEGAPVSFGDLRSDVGVSLLVGRNRVSSSRPAIRFDLAYALDPLPGRGRWLFSAGSQVGF